jgi:hypothetical protein
MTKMTKEHKLLASASIPAASHLPVITDNWLAKQPPERKVDALVAVAAGQAEFACPNMSHLATMAGMKDNKFREARRERGAPIRAKKRSSSQKAAAVQPASKFTKDDIRDLLRLIGSDGLVKVAETIKRIELAERAHAAVATKANGAALNGAALNGAALNGAAPN